MYPATAMRERAGEAREGYAMLIPEVDQGKPGSAEMVRWLIGTSNCSGDLLHAHKCLFQLFTMRLDCMDDRKAIHGIHAIHAPCSLLIHTDHIET